MIFFLIVLTVIILVNFYIYTRTRGLFPASGTGKWMVAGLFWMVAFSYMGGRFVERAGVEWLSGPMIRIGSWWLGAMVYLTLLFLLTDLVRGLSVLPGLKTVAGFSWGDQKGRWISAIIYFIGAVILVAGNYNARHPVIRKIPVVTHKKMEGGKKSVLLASDLHLGTTISTGRLGKMVAMMNEQDADVILLAGDIFDEDLGPVIRNNLGDLLKTLRSKEGVYAILGNHEFYGNNLSAQDYLEKHQITVLRDSIAFLKDSTAIIGREDITSVQMNGRDRKSLEMLLTQVNHSYPVIVMDHQPFRLEEVASYPVDLHVSGHTHHGQLWPFNYITGALFRISKGYGKIGNTHFYVSPGVGTWGPPIRTSCRPEIILLEMTGAAE